MANGTTNSTGFFSKIIAFFTGNPIFAVLSGLLMLAFIMPPRSRKYRSKKRTARRRRRSGTTAAKSSTAPRRKKGKKSKKSKKVSSPRVRDKRTSSANKPPWMVKGSAAAKAHMNRLRAMRKKT
jgi:hypothetical protein